MKCLHNRPDGFILNDRHYIKHALKSPVNQTREIAIKHVKSQDAFTLENLSLNYSFQKYMIHKAFKISFSSAVKSYVKEHLFIYGAIRRCYTQTLE